MAVKMLVEAMRALTESVKVLVKDLIVIDYSKNVFVLEAVRVLTQAVGVLVQAVTVLEAVRVLVQAVAFKGSESVIRDCFIITKFSVLCWHVIEMFPVNLGVSPLVYIHGIIHIPVCVKGLFFSPFL